MHVEGTVAEGAVMHMKMLVCCVAAVQELAHAAVGAHLHPHSQARVGPAAGGRAPRRTAARATCFLHACRGPLMEAASRAGWSCSAHLQGGGKHRAAA